MHYCTHKLLLTIQQCPLQCLLLLLLLPKTYIRPVLTSLLTAIFIILSTWLIIITNSTFAACISLFLINVYYQINRWYPPH